MYVCMYVCIFLSFLYFNKKITCHMEYKYIYFDITDFVTTICKGKKHLKNFPTDTYPTFLIAYHAIRTKLLNYFTIQMSVFLQNFSFFACQTI